MSLASLRYDYIFIQRIPVMFLVVYISEVLVYTSCVLHKLILYYTIELEIFYVG